MPENQPDQDAWLVERPIEDVRRYARRRYALFLVHLVVGILFLGLMLAGGSGVVARAAREIAGPGAFTWTVFYYFAGFSIAYLITTLPLTCYGEYVLEHQFGLSNQTLARWARRRLKKWLFSFIIATPLVLVIYAALQRWPRLWWIPASVVWIFFAYVLAKFAPQILVPLFYKLEKIDDERLTARLVKLASDAGIRLLGAYRIDLSRETKKANAAVIGLGSTRRVVLGDTLLEQFTPDEIAAVFAHELGHVVHHHLIKGFLLAGALLAGSFYAGSLVLARAAAALGIEPVPGTSSAVANPETLPILVAVVAAIQLLVMPFEKWYSRRREVESDAYALRATGAREVFIGAMKKLGLMNLADVSPNKLAEIFLFSHPPIARRIRFAKAFRLGEAE